MAVTCKGLMKIHGYTNAVVFQVETDVGPVYMSFNETTCMERRSVSIVDADIFVSLWRASPYQLHKEIANGTLTSWRNDSKYHYAEDGFSEGITNPVPLAEVNYERESVSPIFWSSLATRYSNVGHVSFTNGITRTIWLLCNGAKAFPVEVSSDRVHELSNVAGHLGAQVENMDALFRTEKRGWK